MKYTMTEPCDACPFLIGSGFNYRQLEAYASGQFACHKACKLRENEQGSDEFVPRSDKTPHCAGALIFHELRGTSTQMMRISERVGLYDHTTLNMKAKVVRGPDDCVQPKRRKR